jgi:hypothetical protein
MLLRSASDVPETRRAAADSSKKVEEIMMDRKQLRARIKEVMTAGGSLARHALLAYAFTRARPYRQIELTTREDNKPSVTMLFTALTGEAVSRDAAVRDTQLARLREWLTVPATPEQLMTVRAQREADIAAKRARSAQIRKDREWDRKVQGTTLPSQRTA